MTVSLIQYIYKNNTLNLGQLINYLQKLNRPDLIALIQQQQTVNKLKNTSGYSSEENKSKTKSMKSTKENFSIEN
ncbi:unnamed protein product [Trichobilharzia szidati]|nr:unnamed protein product [Trichobilharzia szidati]